MDGDASREQMTPEQHLAWHLTRHRMLVELMADFLRHHWRKDLATASLIELEGWSQRQARQPDHEP